MQLNIKNVKVSGGDRRHVLEQFQKFADRFSDRIFSEVELVKLYDDQFAILAYNTDGVMTEHKYFERQDLMVGYILGANSHMSSTHVIKELHK